MEMSEEFLENAEEKGFVEIEMHINGYEISEGECPELKLVSNLLNLQNPKDRLIDCRDVMGQVISFLDTSTFFNLKLVSHQLNDYCHDNVFFQAYQFRKSVHTQEHSLEFGTSIEKIEKYKLGKMKGTNVFRYDHMNDLVRLENEIQHYKKERIQNEVIFGAFLDEIKKIYEIKEKEVEMLRKELNKIQ